MALLMISGTCWRPYWIFKKPMDEILHTLQKLFSYAYINSYRSLKKVCTPFPPYRKNDDISSWLFMMCRSLIGIHYSATCFRRPKYLTTSAFRRLLHWLLGRLVTTSPATAKSKSKSSRKKTNLQAFLSYPVIQDYS